MPRFFLDAPLRAGTNVFLPEDSAHHAVHVLRIHAGDEVTLFNGRGGEYAARVASIQRLNVLVDVLAHRAVERELPLRVVLVQGVSAGERMDFTVRKSVELGVAEIPVVHPMIAASDYRGGAGTKLLLSPASELRFSQAVKDGSEFTIAAGPEAGFNPPEETAFLDAGFVPVRLGARVLRTETAGIAA